VRPTAAWKRKRILIPAAAFFVLATTAGSAVALWTQRNDVVIPINYTTDAGSDFHCSFALSADSAYLADGTLLAEAAEVDALRDFMREHDWSEAGQEAYVKAVDESWVPAGGMPQEQRFNRALAEVISEEFPERLLSDDLAWGAGSDCDGQLH
jgi:hypothetical protein